jgi:hypothetical protein
MPEHGASAMPTAAVKTSTTMEAATVETAAMKAVSMEASAMEAVEASGEIAAMKALVEAAIVIVVKEAKPKANPYW